MEAADRLSPDVIVTDIAMPGIDGIEAAVLIRRHDPNARIVFVTVHAEAMFVEAGLEAGALGYVLKDSAGDELIAAACDIRFSRFPPKKSWLQKGGSLRL